MTPASHPSPRRGLLAAGNFIVDAVVTVDRFPEEETLVDIVAEARTNGGGPFNVLCDLAAMDAGFPLAALGLLGDDDDGRWARAHCVERGIDVAQLRTAPDLATSHTYVVCVAATGRRTFFHRRGANQALGPEHFDFRASSARLFHLGYIMLLDRIDRIDADGRTGAAEILAAARTAGLETSADLVSVEHPDFARIARAALPHLDHLILNEIEAGRVLGRRVPAEGADAVVAAARDLLGMGVHRSVALHTACGGAVVTAGETAVLGALRLPAERCRGANGAGDAFAAGYLYGVHEGWSASDRLRLATGAAAASLADPSPSAGLRPVAACLELTQAFPPRPWA